MDGLLDALRDRLRGPLPIAHEDQWRGGCDGGQHEPAGRRGDGSKEPESTGPNYRECSDTGVDVCQS